MKVARGNPAGGIIRAGAVVVLHEFWADKFIADGTAEEVRETDSADPEAKQEKKNGEKNRKSKS
ncbi:MAG TPA: hypothetical protein VIL74_20640 [Pyrinomonadaceae bacterium]